mmetsp:Transcript_34025/g.51323  ORF Transcript_34025/g.51323 Transcript_34025/m.51323 type:complete len:124 (-) Transcript_34025:127-498(-)
MPLFTYAQNSLHGTNLGMETLPPPISGVVGGELFHKEAYSHNVEAGSQKVEAGSQDVEAGSQDAEARNHKRVISWLILMVDVFLLVVSSMKNREKKENKMMKKIRMIIFRTKPSHRIEVIETN